MNAKVAIDQALSKKVVGIIMEIVDMKIYETEFETFMLQVDVVYYMKKASL